jgi:hypothetical protein
MTAFVAWILFPVVLGLLAMGCGLLLQSASGIKFPPGLHMPAGLALIIVVAEVLTKSNLWGSWSAPLTTPVVVILAILGFLLARPWISPPRIAWWTLAPAVAVYLVYLAPVLLSGEPTFNGFVKLDDSATWMGMTDQVLKTGHAVATLPSGTYASMLGAYLNGGEPVGAMLPWGIAHQIVGQDLGWEFQPYMAFLAGMLTLAGSAIARPLVRSPVMRALVVFIAAQAALIYGYSLWGGIKEVAAAALLVTSVACVIPILEGEARIRTFLPLAAAAFALLGIDGIGGAAWLPVTLLAVGYLTLRIWLRRATPNQLTALGVAALVLVVFLIIGANHWLSFNAGLTSSTEFGNLAHRVRPLQMLGVWPAADFRIDPPNSPILTYLLIAFVFAGVVLALIVSWRERAWVPPLVVGAAAAGALVVSVLSGSPWLQGKGFATVSPAVLLVGLLGLVTIIESPIRVLAPARRPRTVEGFGLMRGLAIGASIAITVGVLWGNALAYGHVTLAPYGQMSELSQIGQRFAGAGPTMINENEPYAGRHFLRQMTPESPSDIRYRAMLLRGGGEVDKGSYADLDQFELATILTYRTIVMRSSPVASRPPAPYRLIYNGRWYQVWQKPTGGRQRPVIDHLPLGAVYDPVGVPACGKVLKLAQEAGRSGLLAAAAQVAPTGISVPGQLPSGKTRESFQVSAPGVYEIFLGGSVVGHLVTSLDGREINSTHEILNEPGGYIPLGERRLGTGVHTVVLSYSGAGLAPGSAGPSSADPPFTDGPLEISTPPGNIPVTYVSPANYRTLCGKPWDWVEALGSSG